MRTLLLRQIREIALLKRTLLRETARREKAEEALKAGKVHYGKLLEQSEQAREEKRLLARKVLLDQEEERRRISRTLHDEISQILSGINLRLAALVKDTTANTGAFRRKIEVTRHLVEKSVDVVHQFARGLRPTLLDDLGLIPALHSFMKDLTQRTGLHIYFTAYSGVEKLANDKRTALYRIAQSALLNVAKHAQATRVTVTIEKHPDTGGIRMEIRDDGISFEVEKVLLAKRYKRLGLISMRERVEMFGGNLAIESSPENGTVIRATLPAGKDQV
jgi:two-component system sensor histidine kinase DegS